MIARNLLGALLALAVAAPCATLARPPYAVQVETIRGHIVAFDGRFVLQVRDPRGYVDNVQLFQGSVIHPAGLRLRVGMLVAIRGAPRGALFVAHEIDLVNQPRAAVPPPRGIAAATLQRYKLRQYIAAQAAARRLAEKLERLYGHHAAPVAVVHVAPIVAPKRRAPKHVTTPKHTAHVAPRHAPLAVHDTAQPSTLLWYGWGKL